MTGILFVFMVTVRFRCCTELISRISQAFCVSAAFIRHFVALIASR